jgi:hypothetical protein
MGKSGTAGASLKSTSNCKEIFIGDIMTMASWLHLLHHIKIFWAKSFHMTTLLSFVRNFISDCVKWKLKMSMLNS